MLSLERQNALREQYRQLRPGWRPATEVYADWVRAYLRPEAQVLDLGCGRGGLVEQLAHPLPQVVGVDPDWLSLVEHRLPMPRTVGWSDRLPFVAGSFDVVFCSWLLEHLPRPERTFAEVGRVLRPGGVFVFITPNGRHPLAWLNRGFGRFSRLQGQVVEWIYGRSATDTFPTHYRANTIPAIQHLCQQNDLRLPHIQAIPDPTYLAFTPFLFRAMRWLEETLPQNQKLHLVGVAQQQK